MAINEITSASAPTTQGGHAGHAQATSNRSGGSFSEALNQAVTRQSGAAPNSSHGSHGGGTSGGGAVSQGGSTHPDSGHSSGITSNSSSASSKHFPIGQGPKPNQHIQQKMMGVRAYQLQMLASNIANADTPGYKAVDIDIAEAYQVVKGGVSPLSLTTTASSHISGENTKPPIPLKYHVPNQASADGNTVEMDTERQKFTEATMMYQFSLDRVSGHFKHVMELLQNLK